MKKGLLTANAEAGTRDAFQRTGVIKKNIIIVKQDNFMLGGPRGHVVKICDFGLSVVMPPCGALSGVHGTAPFMPPEMLEPKGHHGFGVGVWSFGVVVYSQFFGAFPYSPEQKTAAAMKDVIRRGDVPPPFVARSSKTPSKKHISNIAMDFVKALLIREPADRPTAETALTYEYLSEEFQAASKDSWPPPTSLVPMLHGAVRAGAFVTRPPQEKHDLGCALAEMQSKFGSSRGPFSGSRTGGNVEPERESLMGSADTDSTNIGSSTLSTPSSSTKTSDNQ